MARIKVAAIVLNWRTPLITIECVRSLMAADVPVDVYVVDNASGDDSLQIIRTWAESAASTKGYTLLRDGIAAPAEMGLTNRYLCVLDSGRNGGYAFGNNHGIKAALNYREYSFFWILNSDVIVPGPDSLYALLNKMDMEPSIGLCGSVVLYDQSEVVQTLGGGSFNRETAKLSEIGNGLTWPFEVDERQVEAQLAYVNGAATFVRREFIQDVGMMYEEYFLYFEEIDWATRRGPYRLGFAGSSVVYHSVGASIGTAVDDRRSSLSTFYLTRNKILFCRRYYPKTLSTVMLGISRDALHAAVGGKLRRAGTIIWGMVAGILA